MGYFQNTTRTMGQPHELGGGAVFLMSEAGSFVNGQVLSIDGGMSIQV